MNLQQYYFEGAVILMNTMLRGSILYVCEMYHNLKENEILRIERIEEGFMRKIMPNYTTVSRDWAGPSKI